MKLTPCNTKFLEITRRTKYGENQELVLSFSEMNQRCCQVCEIDPSLVYNKTAALNRAIQSLHLDHIKAVTFNKQTYLVNYLVTSTQN